MVLEKQTGFGKLKQSVREYNEKINWIVFALVCIYSWGNWIEILGVIVDFNSASALDHPLFF